MILFPHDTHIIGDPAYPLESWLMVAFRDNGHLTPIQKRFNVKLSMTRSVIERAFALLKGRFRRLKYLDMNRIDLVPRCIVACCVLHNICLGTEGVDQAIDAFIEDGFESSESQNESNDRCEASRTGHTKRNTIASNL